LHIHNIADAVMALAIQYWLNYTKDRIKQQRRSENAVNSGRVLKFVFDLETCMVSSASLNEGQVLQSAGEFVVSNWPCKTLSIYHCESINNWANTLQWQVGLGQGFSITFSKC